MFGSKKEILKYCKNGYIEMNKLESTEISLSKLFFPSWLQSLEQL